VAALCAVVIFELRLDKDSLVLDFGSDSSQQIAHDLLFLRSEICCGFGLLDGGEGIPVFCKDVINSIAELSVLNKTVGTLVLVNQALDFLFSQLQVQSAKAGSELKMISHDYLLTPASPT
jgi:hypothetical protein